MRYRFGLAISSLLTTAGVSAAPVWIANGPDGGGINVIAASPGWLYAASRDGLFRSNDQGINWQRSGIAIPRGTSVLTVNVSPHDAGLVFAGSNGFVHRSVDGGATWASVAVSGMPSRFVFSSQVAYRDEVLFATASTLSNQAGALQRSSNAGLSWQPVIGPSGSPLLAKGAAADPARDRYYVLDGGPHLLFSADGAQTWSQAGQVGIASNSNRLPMLVDRANNDFVVWSADNLDATYVYRQRASTGVNTQVLTAYAAQELAADPAIAGRLWFSAIHEFSTPPQRLFESTNSGQNWVDVNADRPVRMMSSDPVVSGRLYGATSAGPEVSEDAGRHWETRSHGIPLAASNAVLMDPRDPAVVLAATDGNGVWRSSDAGQHWQRSSGLDHLQALSLARSLQQPDVLYAGVGDRVYTSTDGGLGWSQLPATPLPPGAGSTRFSRMYVDRADSRKLVALNSSLSRVGWSDDGGLSWRAPVGLQGAAARRLVASPDGSGRVYVLGSPSTSQALRRADSHGADFTAVGAATPFYALAVHPDNDARLLSIQPAPLGPTVFLSNDAGDSWTPRGTIPIAGTASESHLRFDPCDPETIYAATGSRIYRSNDLSLTWQQESAPLQSSRHSDMDARCLGGSLTVAVASTDTSIQVRTDSASDRILRSGFDDAFGLGAAD